MLTGPVKDIFVKKDLKGLSLSDPYGVRLVVHDSSLTTLQVNPGVVEGRLIVRSEEPKRIVVLATEQFNLSGSAESLMQFCHMVDEAVSSMMAYAYSPEKQKWL